MGPDEQSSRYGREHGALPESRVGGCTLACNPHRLANSSCARLIRARHRRRARPQERYDIFINNFTERTWVLVTIGDSIKKLMKTYAQYPPRKLQSESYSGPVTLTQYERFQFLRDSLAKEGIKLPLPTGN
jgi:hypothetical protein